MSAAAAAAAVVVVVHESHPGIATAHPLPVTSYWQSAALTSSSPFDHPSHTVTTVLSFGPARPDHAPENLVRVTTLQTVDDLYGEASSVLRNRNHAVTVACFISGSLAA